MARVGGGIGVLIGILLFVLVASNLIGPILTAITDTAGLAVVGSIAGGAALIMVLATLVIVGLIIMVVEMVMPGTLGRVTGGRVGGGRRRRSF